MENKLFNNIVKYYIEELQNNNGVTKEEAEKMINFALQNEDNNLDEIF